MNWLRNFMIGRYGTDQLSMALLVLALIISAITSFIPIPILRFLMYIPVLISFFRVLSKDVYKRRQENYKFMKMWSPIVSWFKNQVNIIKNSKTHKYYKCPNCSQQLRVPKGKGTIRITCTKCKTQFIKKT